MTKRERDNERKALHMDWKGKRRDTRILMGMLLLAPFLLIPPLVTALFSGATYGPITLDGNMADWPGRYRLDLPPWHAPLGTELYGCLEEGNYVFALVSPELTPGARVTIWLNTDQDASTGYRIWGSAGGAEYNVDFAVGSDPTLYKGAAGESVVAGPLECGVGTGAVELAVPVSSLYGTPKAINILVDIGGKLYLPSDFSQTQYAIAEGSRPPRTDPTKRVGIVFSQVNAGKFHDAFSYSQLVMALQHQSMMAGLPFDVLEDSSLENLENLVNYDVLVLPYMAHVEATKLARISETLTAAVHAYHIGLMAAGNLLTNDSGGIPLPGDSYSRQRSLLGVGPVAFQGPVASVVRATDVSHPVMRGYTAGETILTYDSIWYGTYVPQPGVSSWMLAAHETGGAQHPAATATYTGGRNVFFSNEQVMADGNLAWSALRWIVHGDSVPVGLKMGREKSLFCSRNDMDQSMYFDEFQETERPLLQLITRWKDQYDFVGSYYINVGNAPAAGERTDWTLSGPLYRSYLALGNEIGTHSYTHPDYTSQLTDQQLDFEFRQSKEVISAGVPTDVRGAAIPGNPETLAVNKAIMPHFTYVSGRYSAKGSGYPGAFGTLAPGITGTYFCLNMLPDFTLIEFQKQTAEQAEQVWSQEYDALTTHANLPIIHWMWHDYGPTIAVPDGYSVAMYENLIAKARNAGAEFVTGRDLARRIAALRSSGVKLTQKGNILSAEVRGSDLGSFALEVDSSQVIKKVAHWYAYDGRKLFLPLQGRRFEVELGSTPDPVTRITRLPMRAQLMSLEGDGVKLNFGFVGQGTVRVALGNVGPKGVTVTGADSHQVEGSTLTLQFATDTMHTVKIAPAKDGPGKKPR
ncbi:MAG: cadherin [Candidatus Riflebacteria bacterium]|nr:cadherin [Candidatus Riflebacteria bacterium]